MRLLRGRAGDSQRDHERTGALVESVASDREAALRVWTPHRQVAFGRRDRRAEGYEMAQQAARDRGYAVLERAVGGRAVAYTGSTVAFSLVEPTTDGRETIQARYDRASAVVKSALDAVGVDAREGEPPDAFCPGSHSLQCDGKLVGLAQRVTSAAAVTAGVLVVEDHEAIGAVLAPVYDALDVRFDPGTVGSIERAGGNADTSTVVRALEDAFVGDEEPRVETIRDT